MAAKQSAEAVWEHDLLHGSGHVRGLSGAIPSVPLSWSTRTENAPGKSSPEELLAAALAGCYSMALANTLAKGGTPPDRVTVTATSTFDKVGDAWRVTTMDLRVRAKVPKLEAAGLQAAADAAAKNCPISKALAGNVEIRAVAELE